jgi:hypothetical protein
VGGGTASNIASVVWNTKYTNASNVKASTFGSLTRTTASAVSDVESALDSQFVIISDFISDFGSRVPKRVATDSQLSDVWSDLRSIVSGVGGGTASNIASVVWGTAKIGNQTAGTFGSAAIRIASDVSDVLSRVPEEVAARSQLSDVASDLRSYLAGRSQLSDLVSDLRSYMVGMSGALSDVESALDSQFAWTSNALSDMPSQVWDFGDVGVGYKELFAIHLTQSTAQSGTTSTLKDSDIANSLDSGLIDFYVWPTSGNNYHIERRIIDYDATSKVLTVSPPWLWPITAGTGYYVTQHPSPAATNAEVSNIASVVESMISSELSDILSAATLGASRASVLLSRVSDVESALDSQFAYLSDTISNLQSDVLSYLAGISDVISNIDSALDRHDQNLFLSRNKATGGAAANILLAAAEPATNSLYNDLAVALVAGAGTGQVRPVINYVGSTRMATVTPNWEVAPDSTTSYVLLPQFTHHSNVLHINSVLESARSVLSDFESNFQSRVPKPVATDSQVSGLVSDLLSFMTGMSGAISDIESAADSQYSDLASKIGNVSASVGASSVSDIASAVWAFGTAASRIAALPLSDMSDLRSAIFAGPTATVTASDISNIASAVQTILSDTHSNILSAAQQASSRAVVTQSMVSNVDSALTSQFAYLSDIVSTIDFELGSHQVDVLNAVGNLETSLDSQLSDIRSRVSNLVVDTGLISHLYDATILWKGVVSSTIVGGSEIEINGATGIPDSYLIGAQMMFREGALSGMAPRTIIEWDGVTNKAIVSPKFYAAPTSGLSVIIRVGGSGVTLPSNLSDVQSQVDLNASMISDTQSQVDLNASVISDVQSYLVAMSAAISNIDSALASQSSDIRSQFGGVSVALTASDISNITSAILTAQGSTLSDILSAAQQANSRAVVIESWVSDIDSQLTATDTVIDNTYSLLSDHASAFISKVTGVVPTGSDIASKVWAEKYTEASNVKASTFGLIVQRAASGVSDVESALDSQFAYMSAAVSNLDSAVDSQFVYLSAALSDLDSQVNLNASLASDAHSAATLAAGRASALQSSVSDVDSQLTLTDAVVDNIYSLLSDHHSDFLSRVTGAFPSSSDVASKVWAEKYTNASNVKPSSFGLIIRTAASNISNVESQLDVTHSLLSDVESAADAQYAALSNMISSTQSDLRSYLVGMSGAISDIDSALTSQYSDLRSAASGRDVAADSQYAALSNMISDLQSDLRSYLVGMSGMLSDIDSALTSQHSDLRSAVSTVGGGAGVTASDISDIASAVEATQASRLSDILSAAQAASSKATVLASSLSDVDSALTSQYNALSAQISDVESQLDLNASNLSDVESALDAHTAVYASDTSDIVSGLSQLQSRITGVLATSSVQSDIYSLLSDVSSRIPAALVGGRINANLGAINNSSDAAINLSESAKAIKPGTVDTVINTHTPTTSEFQADDITEATADHYNGRIVIFTTGALTGQATDITDYVAVGGIGQFTVTPMTEAPANNDEFVIV